MNTTTTPWADMSAQDTSQYGGIILPTQWLIEIMEANMEHVRTSIVDFETIHNANDPLDA